MKCCVDYENDSSCNLRYKVSLFYYTVFSN